MGAVPVGGREVLASPLMPPAAQALTDMIEISAQIQAAVVFDRDGTVLASTLEDDRARMLAGSALGFLRAAEEARPDEETGFAQLDASLRDGCVFLVADGDHVIAATTAPEPTVGLVFYDLKRCLDGVGEESVEPEPAKPKRAPTRRTTTARTTRKKDDAKP
jgi:predicted regulator of Ras-like GTPase activity (Roadblock/LC7/MglB family)